MFNSKKTDLNKDLNKDYNKICCTLGLDSMQGKATQPAIGEIYTLVNCSH